MRLFLSQIAQATGAAQATDAMGSYTQCGVTVNDTSAWATKHQLVVLTGEGCINYGDITNPQIATASIGTWSVPATDQAFAQQLQTPEAIKSAGRHKVITTMEYDPRTVSNIVSDTILPGLLTIPYSLDRKSVV